MRLARGSVLLVALSACHRRGGAADGGVGDVGVAEAGPSSAMAPPIAAARLRNGTLVVAGMVASRSAVAATALGDDGKARWSVDALPGVPAGSNVELSVFPASDGAAVVVFRGRRAGRAFTQGVLVDGAGHLAGPAFEAGAGVCATEDALAWIDRAPDGAARILGRPWGRTEATELARVAAEREPAVVCGSRAVFALGDGEQDTTVASAPGPSRTVMRDRDFSDEEREHDTFVVGDTLGLVRVGQTGTLSARDVGIEMSPWRRAALRLTEADDVVVADGDADTTTVVFTHDEGAACDGPSAPSVHALQIPKKPGAAESASELASAQCDRELGPFFTGSVGRALVVAWVERAAVRAPGDPPVVALAYRTLGGPAPAELRRVALSADDLVDAGCEAERCYAVALVRPRAGEPDVASLRVLTYP